MSVPSDEIGEGASTNPVVVDAPIESASQDRLNRVGFAKALGNALVSYDPNHSVVIGLEGPWGAGKTSVLNMAVEWVSQNAHSQLPSIVYFNPWEWSTQEALFRAFFDQLRHSLDNLLQPIEDRPRQPCWRRVRDHVRLSARRRKLRNLWGQYSDRLLIYNTAMQGAFSTVGPAKALGVAALAYMGGAITDTSSKAVVLTAAVLLIGPAVIKVVLELPAYLASVRDKQLAREGKSALHDVRHSLAAAFQETQRHLLVVIDDVDRLTPDQIATIFQLVKANGDFPRLVYVLVFHRQVIENALKEARKVNGADYLEKLVQRRFELPLPDRELVKVTLRERLLTTLRSCGLADEFDWKRWDTIYSASLDGYFPTIRHLTRYLDVLAFQYATLSVDGALEVDATDLAVLEVIHLSEPGIHAVIGRRRILFTGAQHEESVLAAKRDEIDQMLGDLLPAARSAVLEILKQLFPSVGEAFGDRMAGPPFQAHDPLQRRVCNEEFFDRYFVLSTPTGELSRGEAERVVRLIDDGHTFNNALNAAETSGSLKQLLQRLPLREWLGNEQDLAVIVPLLDVADPEALRRDVANSAVGTIQSLLQDWLRRVWPEHAGLIVSALQDSIGLLMAVRISTLTIRAALSQEQLRYIAERTRSATRDNTPIKLPAEVEQCIQLCVARLQMASTTARMNDHPCVYELLEFWRDWGDSSEVQAWTSAYAESDAHLMNLLRSFWYRWDRVGESWQLIVTLDSLFRANELENRLERLPLEGLEAQDLTIVKECRSGLREAKQKGVLLRGQ